MKSINRKLFLRKSPLSYDIILYAANVNGRGTRTITENTLNALFQRKDFFKSRALVVVPKSFDFHCDMSGKNAKVIRVSERGWLSRIELLFSYIYVSFITIFGSVKRVLIFANFFPLPLWSEEIIIVVRHPYLMASKEGLSGSDFILERMRDLLFWVTTKVNNTILIVQTNTMKRRVISSSIRFLDLYVVPNPIKIVDEIKFEEMILPEKYFVYPSRYYPHKDFEVILSNAKHYEFSIVLTVNEIDWNRLTSKYTITDNVINIGEIGHGQIVSVISESEGVIFPSKRETFGNGIYEALGLGKPILLGNYPYTSEFKDQVGVYIVDFNDSGEVNRVVRDFPKDNRKIQFNNITENEWIEAVILR